MPFAELEEVVLSAFNSIQRSPGTYRDVDGAEVGQSRLRHIDVNSGHSMSISKSRSGRGFGNVSIAVLDITEKV
jgi:hypothetical protein